MAQMPIPFFYSDNNCPTFKEFLDETFWPDKQNLRYLTLQSYRADVKLRLMPAFKDVKLNEIDYSAIQRMINNCPTYKQARKAKETLSAILGHAVKTRKLFFNPAIGQFIYPDQIVPKEKPQGEWLTNFSQIAYVLDVVRNFEPGGELERICLLGFGSGLRNGEIFGVDWEDIDLEHKTLFVHQSYTRAGQNGPQLHGLKTRSSLRKLPLFDYVVDRIKDIKNNSTITSGAFVVNNGLRSNPSTAANHFRAFRELCGLPNVTIATMRHSFATAMLRSGRPLPIVQQWLGHTTSTTTLRYCKPQVGDLAYDARLISSQLNKEFNIQEPIFDTVSYSEREKIHSVITNDSSFVKNIEQQLKPSLKPKLKDDIEAQIAKNPKITREELAEVLHRSPKIIKDALDLLHKTGKLAYRREFA